MDENLTPQDQVGQTVPPQPEMPPIPQAPQPEVPEMPSAPQPSAPVAPEAVPQPQVSTQDYVQPVQQDQYYQVPQPQTYGSDTGDYFNGYFDGLLCFFKDTNKFVNTLLYNLNKMWMFLGINMIALFGSVLAVSYSIYIFTIKWYSRAFGFLGNIDISIPWGEIIKSSLIVCVGFVFFAAIISLMLSVSKKGKENGIDFVKGLAFSSILSVTIPYIFIIAVIFSLLIDVLITSSGIGLILLSISSVFISVSYIYSIVVFVEALRDKAGFTALKGVVNLVLALFISGFVFGFISGVTGNRSTVPAPNTSDIFKTNGSYDFDGYK